MARRSYCWFIKAGRGGEDGRKKPGVDGSPNFKLQQVKNVPEFAMEKGKKKAKEERAMATYRNARTKNWLKFIAVRGGTVGVKWP